MANAGWRHKKREGYSPRIMKLARTAKKRRADIMTGPRILSVNGVRGVEWGLLKGVSDEYKNDLKCKRV
jgi:hypothetical protein